MARRRRKKPRLVPQAERQMEATDATMHLMRCIASRVREINTFEGTVNSWDQRHCHGYIDCPEFTEWYGCLVYTDSGALLDNSIGSRKKFQGGRLICFGKKF